MADKPQLPSLSYLSGPGVAQGGIGPVPERAALTDRARVVVVLARAKSLWEVTGDDVPRGAAGLEGGKDVAALFSGLPAPGMEPATGRRVDRRGNLPPQHNPSRSLRPLRIGRSTE